MSVLRWAGPVLLVVGIALVAAAVATGAAQVLIVLVFPVFVGGASLLFFAGVLALILGIFLLPLAFVSAEADPAPVRSAAGREPGAGSGGLILVGPVPIFFGTWKNPGRRAYWVAAVVGAALLLVAFVVAWSLS